MKVRIKLGAVLVFLLAACAPCMAQPKPPYELVRSLHALQDQMVLGNDAARGAAGVLARRLAVELRAYPAAAWRDPRNVRAVVTYVLSGGAPRVAQKVLASGVAFPNVEKNLLEGALAYSEGHEARARSRLAGIDPRTLEPIVGGHIALVQAALVVKKDPQKAVALLDIARVLAPGTLIEEAALRREIFLINAAGDFDKFIDLSGQYIRRFHNSAYADNFREHFSQAVARLDIEADSQRLQRIDDALSSLDPGDQLKIYLMIARASVLNGKIAAARFAASKAEGLANPETSESCRAKLYDGAAEIFTSAYARGVGELKALNATRLSHEEASLKEAALSLSQQIHEWPRINARASVRNLEEPTQPILEAALKESDVTLDSAQKALAEADDLMKAKSP